MADEEFYHHQTDCQQWEICATESYYDNNNRHLFTKDNVEGESRGYADDATWILTSSFVIFTMQSGKSAFVSVYHVNYNVFKMKSQ